MEIIIIIAYLMGLLGTILGFVVGNYLLVQRQGAVKLLFLVLLWPIFIVILVLDILIYFWSGLTMSKTLLYVIGLLVILIILGVCTYANAAPPVKISPPVNVFYPVTYPDSVSKMTDTEFFKWATARNKASRADWQERYFLAGDEYVTHNRMTTKSRYTGMGSMQSVIVTGGKLGKTGGRSFTQQYKSTYRYKNPNFRHPGSLTLINPYFRKK